MGIGKWIIWFLLFSCMFRSDGNSDPSYRACVEQCEKTGCVGGRCFSHCKLSSDRSSLDDPLYMRKPSYWQLKHWYCQSDCQYHCMAEREKERAEHGEEPIKYNGKWLLQHFYCFQEPVSVALSTLNFVLHLHGWRNFHSHVYTKLPLRRYKRPFYDYTGLWSLYGFFSINSCLWTAVYHSRMECKSVHHHGHGATHHLVHLGNRHRASFPNQAMDSSCRGRPRNFPKDARLSSL